MKIIAKDNYDRDTVSDELVAEKITQPGLGRIMVDALNNKSQSNDKFFKLVSDDHKLYLVEP